MHELLEAPQNLRPCWDLKCFRLRIAAIIALSLGRSAVAATCDRACLLQQATQFNRNMLAHTTGKIALAPAAEIRENTKAISLGASKWSTVKQIRSEGVFTDPALGNVIEHIAAETDAGKIVYIGTRLKVVDGKITEVEINFDDPARGNAKNLIPYDPLSTPSCQKASVPLVSSWSASFSYFQGLTDHKPTGVDYEPRCDRYHSGNHVTHNARNGVVKQR